MKTKKSKKVKEISLPMKYNPGLAKFEPDLPLIKRKTKIKVHWIIWIIILVALISLGYVIFINLL